MLFFGGGGGSCGGGAGGGGGGKGGRREGGERGEGGGGWANDGQGIRLMRGRSHVDIDDVVRVVQPESGQQSRIGRLGIIEGGECCSHRICEMIAK